MLPLLDESPHLAYKGLKREKGEGHTVGRFHVLILPIRD